uniref:Uncharacterized protein n=1 Tax=Trichuris muris TaxID=70415 RepID=A0A5S6QKA4_TRIMR
MWQCSRKECRKELSVKTGTWFQGCEQHIGILFIRPWEEVSAKVGYFSLFRRFAAKSFLIRVGNVDAVVVQSMRKTRHFLIGRSFCG